MFLISLIIILLMVFIGIYLYKKYNILKTKEKNEE